MPYASRRDLLRTVRVPLATLLMLCLCAFAAAAQEPPVPSPGCGPGHPKPDAQTFVLADFPPGAKPLTPETLARRSAFIGIGTTSSAVAHVSQPTREIYKDVTFKSFRFLKLRPGIPKPGVPVHLRVWGGTAMIGDKCTESLRPGINVQAGRSYLVFGVYDTAGAFYGTDWIEVFSDGELWSMPLAPWDLAFNQRAVLQVLKRIANELAVEAKETTK